MRFRFLIPYLLLFPLIIIQMIIIPILSLDGTLPDLLLILVVLYTIIYGRIYGLFFGAFSGLAFDLATGGILGGAMFSKTIVAFIASYFSKENRREINIKTFRFQMIVFLCGIIHTFSYSLFSSFDISANFLNIIFHQGVIPALYSAVFSIAITFFYPRRNLAWQT